MFVTTFLEIRMKYCFDTNCFVLLLKDDDFFELRIYDAIYKFLHQGHIIIILITIFIKVLNFHSLKS